MLFKISKKINNIGENKKMTNKKIKIKSIKFNINIIFMRMFIC